MARLTRTCLIVLAIATAGLLSGVGHADSPQSRLAALTVPAARDAIALPSVLSASDANLYRRIFALGEQEQWASASDLIGQVQDRVLMGHVLAQRYLSRSEKASYAQLQEWLAAYADHPDAARIYALALRKKSKRDSPPQAPWISSDPLDSLRPTRRTPPPLPEATLGESDRRRAEALDDRVRSAIRGGALDQAIALVQSAEDEGLWTSARADELRAKIGDAAFRAGNDELALQLAGAAAQRSSYYVPEAHWTAGLAAWRLGQYGVAAGFFEEVARRDDMSSWMISAGGFWAARAYLFAGRPNQVNRLLRVAADHPRTFYGLLSRRILGLPMPFHWAMTADEQMAIKSLARAPEARRALALLQVGERDRAERELRWLIPTADPEVARGIVAIAGRTGMAELAVRFHGIVFTNGEGFDAANYPVPDWMENGGFNVDRALILAFIRQESRFNPDAVSSAGARGLMQLMPATARFVSSRGGPWTDGGNGLFERETNLALGQAYMEMLLASGAVGGDLFRLATAWNGGPGNLQKWDRSSAYMGDPLLFIECLPARETRIFIEQVLANLWIYRHRLGQPSPELDAVAAGEWPSYARLDPSSLQIAHHGTR